MTELLPGLAHIKNRPARKLHEQEGGRALGHDLLVVGEVPGALVGQDVLTCPPFPASRRK